MAHDNPSMVYVVMQNDFPAGASVDLEVAKKIAVKLREQHPDGKYGRSVFVRIYEFVDGKPGSKNEHTY